MLVYLVRHAIAEERDPAGRRDDGARRLTDRGVSRMKQNVAALAAIGVELEEIWTSPLVRAAQTADLLARLLKRGGRIETVDELGLSGGSMAIRGRLAQTDDAIAVALVGHEPDMGELASLLLFGSATSAVRFKKGGVACIALEGDIEPGAGVLQWMLTPKQMRAMA